MCQFMCHDIQRLGKTNKDFAVAVTKGHLIPVPKRIHIILPVMNIENEIHSIVIDGVAFE